jgi:hypothetical protein
MAGGSGRISRRRHCHPCGSGTGRRIEAVRTVGLASTGGLSRLRPAKTMHVEPPERPLSAARGGNQRRSEKRGARWDESYTGNLGQRNAPN